MPEPTVHNYLKPWRFLGHDYIFKPEPGGRVASMQGWGENLRPGDFILMGQGADDLDTFATSARYCINTIRYENDPHDMWQAQVEFAPRSPDEKAHDFIQAGQDQASWPAQTEISHAESEI